VNAQVAAEIRAELGRRGMSNADLARLLGVSEAWTTRRLGKKADTVLNMVDMQRIAAALSTPLATFFTAEIREVVPPGITGRYPFPAVRTMAGGRPADNRPNGRALAAASTGPGRTAYVERRRRD
jgi:transcriptional regulator with XRE-family HTH domain